MNRSLLIAIALPSMMFYQSNAPILYSSEKLIEQVKEEQVRRSFDLSESRNMLIITNDRIEENAETVPADEAVEPEQPPDQVNEETSSIGERSSDETSSTSETTQSPTTKSTLPKTGKKASRQTEKTKSTEALETIEQKISALPLAELPTDKTGERELVRMLASMSGTILYGTKMTETNKQEYITF